MAEYLPPTEDLPVFNTLNFLSTNNPITIAEGDSRYLRFPTSQGSETINGNLTITGEGFCATVPSTNNSLANKLYVDNAVIGGSILGTNNTWTGTNAFNSFLPTSTATPTTGTQLTTKTYVDTASASLLGTNNTWTGTNAFNTSLPTSTITGYPFPPGTLITNTYVDTVINFELANFEAANNTWSGTNEYNTNLPTSTQTPTTGTQLTTKTYVDSAVSGASILGTNNTFTGTNAFNTSLPTSTQTPTTGTQLTTKTYVDTAVSGVSILGTNNTFTGTNAFNAFLPTSTATPTTGTELTTKTYVDSAISGASILGTNNTWTGTNSFGTTNISGQLTMGTANQILTNLQEGTTATTSVLLYSENARSGTINLGTGTTGKVITIGNSGASTVALAGSTITATKMAIAGVLSAGASTLTSVVSDTFTTSTTATTASLFGEASRGGNINIGIGATRSGTINIGNGGGTGDIQLLTNGSGTTLIGNNSATTRLIGTVQLNNTGTASTAIGNATGTTTFTGQATFLGNTQFGDAAADFIVPNGTLTKPFIIGTYASQSSFSLSSITPVNTYLGGTIESTNTKSGVASGTFFYAMSNATAIAPYDTGGGIALTAGTYMFWMGLSIEDTAAFDATDIRMGLSLNNTLSASSTEAQYRAAIPNLTCYFHKTDAAAAVATDSENRVLSSCFNIASATTMYPFFICNTSVNIDTYTVDIIFTKIGSA
jgi:hypothetical protein